MFTSRSNGGTVVTSWPCSRIRPSLGSSKPAIIRSVVVLPEPDGPSIEKNSPSYTSRSMPATATIGYTPPVSMTLATRRPASSSPKRLTTPSSRIATLGDVAGSIAPSLMVGIAKRTSDWG